MSAFAVNLVTQFFGVKTSVANKATFKSNAAGSGNATGAATVGTTADGKIYLMYQGIGGLMRSDLIDPALVKWAKYVDADALKTKTQAYTITPSAAVLAENIGGDVILRIDIKNFCGDLSANNHYFKHAAVRVKKSMFTSTTAGSEALNSTSTDTAPSFIALMAMQLAKSFARENDPMVKIEAITSSDPIEVKKTTAASELTGATAIKITALRPEVDPIMHVGLNDELDFEVYCGSYNDAIDEDVWGVIAKVDGLVMSNTDKIEALEDFALKERGDIYGYTGYPYVHPSKTFLSDPDGNKRSVDDGRDGYDVLTIHFAYQGANELVHLSEKDLTIAGPTATIVALLKMFAAAGVVFDTVTVVSSKEKVTEANVAGKILADADADGTPDVAAGE